MHDNQVEQPVIISIMSGKGGVGKTSFALALANELSAAGNKVLLLDADFSNRGLSELMRDYEQRAECPVNLLNELLLEKSPSRPNCSFVYIQENLVALLIPPLDSEQLGFLEARPVSEMKKAISQLVMLTVRQMQFDTIVVDCHGGRDVVSFGVAGISDHVIVINVPEISTFFGTLNLLADLEKEQIASTKRERSEFDTPKLHMVFNMAQRGFRRRMLSYWYRRYFSKYFSGQEFLSIIAFDPRISIATATKQLPTRRLHYSSMSEKMRCIVVELFVGDDRVKLTSEAVWVANLMGPLVRGRRPLLFIRNCPGLIRPSTRT